MIEAKQLVDAGICCSFAEARRMISGLPEEKILEKLNKVSEKNNIQWGRPKTRQNTRIVWPKKIIEIE
jgi:hypothetical protein